MSTRRFLLVSFLLSVGGGLALAQPIPVTNWTVPIYRNSSASGGLSTMTDVSPGIAFVAMSPCRVVDTRNAPGPYGGPSLSTNVSRTFDIDNGPCTGIPAGVDAYSLSIGGILPPADGFLTAWPTGIAQPLISQLNLLAGEVVANAAIVPAGTGGSINVLVNIGPTNVYIDINGYFTDQFNPTVSFHAVSGTVEPAILGENTSTAASAVAVRGVITSATPGSNAAAVRGINNGTEAEGVGVWGSHAGNGLGVHGTTVGGTGVFGHAATTTGSGIGVLGVHDGVAFGVYGESAAGTGVYGESLATVGTSLLGVGGITYSAGQNTAGVRGFNVSTGQTSLPGNFLAAGVRGENNLTGFGVLGLTTTGYSGASGYHLTAGGVKESGADLGFTATVGVNVTGTIEATGMKNFVEPHPTDASKVIRYASLEGNEVGTYFRGRGKFQNGIAVIEVPEDFRIVTDPDGLSIQVTPIGDMATVAVQSIGLDRIVVRGSRNVEFFYTVNGIRLAYRDVGPIAENEKVFVPRSPEERMPESYPAVLRERLISNGTYKADGTVNMETARRLGWDREWEKRERPAPEPASD